MNGRDVHTGISGAKTRSPLTLAITLGVAVAVTSALLVVSAFAQRGGRGAADQGMQGLSGQGRTDSLGDLRFRSLGPAVAGGRVSAVAGVPGQPNVFYVGAAGGGVFKTTDGGINWRGIWDNMPTASIGAIALAPQNPNWVWVGTGEGNPRNDVITGHGVFFSSDGGTTWKSMGLENAGQIPVILVSPTNPNLVYVAALGHVWGPNADRGVFRTTDGGKSWQKVLYVDDTTGACDLVMDPANPMVLYAGMWQYKRFPWILESGGASSGLYRTTDGGENWRKLSAGLPSAPTGRSAIAIAPSDPSHIYALVESKNGVLWESRDSGDRWTKVSDDRSIQARPFYFSHLYVSPDNEDRIYFLSYDIMLSTDGGRSAHIIAQGVHPDHHVLWIDPRDPAHLVEGNDGGIYVSSDQAAHWRYLDNLPIEQFYSVALDDHYPYMVCGGLQDNNGWCGPSNSMKGGGIGPGDWWVVAGGDGQYVVPGLNGNRWIYGDSQGGAIVRSERADHVGGSIRPYLMTSFDLAVSDMKYRFNWTAPIAVDSQNPNDVFIGGNVLFRSRDSGWNWTPISPDLTRNEKSKQALTGGPIILDISSAENYDTILSISISPLDPNTVWVGTDDGLVQVTQDGGAHWSNVAANIPSLPQWGRISQIDASPFAAGGCTVAVDFHETENNKPYVFKTTDFGKTWTSITRNLPEDYPVHVVRENPNRKGMLVAGTDTGLFYSVDDQPWQPMHSNFPVTPVFDVKFEKRSHDLVVATHGRGVFIMDDISPLEQMQTGGALQLFPVATAYRLNLAGRGGFSSGAFVAPNPPDGAVIHYSVPPAASGGGGGTAGASGGRGPGASITVSDSTGKIVRKMNGPARPGINRVVWPFVYDGPTPLSLPGAGGGEEEGGGGGGRGGSVQAPPGIYDIAVTANGQTQTQKVHVEADPKFKGDNSGFQAQLKAGLEVRDALSSLNEVVNRIEAMRAQLRTLTRTQSNQELANRARELDAKLDALEQPLYNTTMASDSKYYLHSLSRLSDRLIRLLGAISGNYGLPPSQPVLEEWAEVRAALKAHIEEFNKFLATDAPAFNKFAADQGMQAIAPGKPVEWK
ncbi:MAG TPA: hypothetical protein VN774_02610 [Candidatus Limnocylindrales bacterium]|nr:hypothetical protein [Candidatus Limnocylindrales bacterium]